MFSGMKWNEMKVLIFLLSFLAAWCCCTTPSIEGGLQAPQVPVASGDLGPTEDERLKSKWRPVKLMTSAREDRDSKQKKLNEDKKDEMSNSILIYLHYVDCEAAKLSKLSVSFLGPTRGRSHGLAMTEVRDFHLPK